MTDAELATIEADVADWLAESHVACWCGRDETAGINECDMRAAYVREVPALIAEVRRLQAALKIMTARFQGATEGAEILTRAFAKAPANG